MSYSQAWEETAAQYARDVEYYRGLLVQIGEMLGEAAYIADDGGRHEDVLCAKVPELVKAALAELHRVTGLWYGACAARTERAVEIAELRKRLDEGA